MNGMKHLFMRILPIITLICFISFGILQIFPVTQENQNNITYLEKEQVNIGTEENPNYKELYTLDLVQYTQNIDQNILSRSIQKTVQFDTYSRNLARFEEIWEDGYQVFDVAKTMANGIVLTINTLILPINILLVPLRIISGIILTAMSLVGININEGTIIAPTLNFIVDQLAIPFLGQQTDEEEIPTIPTIAYTNWVFENRIEDYYETDEILVIDFTFQQKNVFGYYTVNGTKIEIKNNNGIIQLIYWSGNTSYIVYRSNNGWAGGENFIKYITISENANYPSAMVDYALSILNVFARRA